MESPVLRLKKQKGPNLILLTHAKTILEEDVKVHAKWEIIEKWYKDTESHPDVEWIDKAMTTIINSIVHQNRIVFGVTKEKIRNLLKNDKNWNQSLGLKNNNYRLLFKKLIEAGILEEYKEQEFKKPWGFRVVSEEIKNMLDVNVSEKDQEKEFDELTNNSNDLNEGTLKGPEKGDTEIKKYRNIEMKTENHVENEPTKNIKNKINFKQLLVVQHPNKFPSFDDIPHLVQLAIENCEDFEPDAFTTRTFERHLLGQCKKPSSKQKDFIKKLVSSFEFESEKYYNLKITEGFELKEPEEIKVNALATPSIDLEALAQENTVSVIKNMGGGEKIRLLKKKLDNATTDEQKYYLQKEIELWEGLLC